MLTTPSYYEQITFLLDRNSELEGLKQDRRNLLVKILDTSKEMTKLEKKFNVARKVTDKNLSNKRLTEQDLEELVPLVKQYKKVTRLFRKYSREAMEIQLKIIAIKSSTYNESL